MSSIGTLKSMRHVIYKWWKQKPSKFRKPLVFGLGILLVIISPIVGTVPGPGGIAIFIIAIAILGSEFDWALELKSILLSKLPAEVKNRWRPTPKWQTVFDFTSFVLLLIAGLLAYNSMWWTTISFGTMGLFLFLFNRSRLDRLKKTLRSIKR